jgi:hypothetical protein
LGPCLIKLGSAETVFEFLAFQNTVIDTMLATLPEIQVPCDFSEGDWLKTEFAVKFHHGRTTGNAKNMGIWEKIPA